MGEIAEAVLEGVLCEQCGEYLGEDGPGHPRLCTACLEENEKGTGPGFPSPYEEGEEAYYRGDGIETNPYDNKDGQHEEWEDGWLSAEDQEQRR